MCTLASETKSLNELFEVLLKAWIKETAYPSCQKDPQYNRENDPTYGQCAITATLVYDMFGGTIHRIRTPSGGTHCFNKLNDNYVDLTSEQFDLYGILVDYEKNRRMTRDYCFIKEETVARYKQLQRNIIYYLTQYEDDFWED